MSDLTPRDVVVRLVQGYASRRNQPTRKVYRGLYEVFNQRTGVDWTREAYKAKSYPLEYIEKHGAAGELMLVARELFEEEKTS